MTTVTNTTQLDLFPTIRTVLRNNTTLAANFSESQIVEYEPAIKSSNFPGFPYIVVNIPETDTELSTLKHDLTFKDFVVTCELVVEYHARDKVRGFCNDIIYQMETSEDTFEAIGYYNDDIDLISKDDEEIIEEKRVVRVTFEFMFSGGVCR